MSWDTDTLGYLADAQDEWLAIAGADLGDDTDRVIAWAWFITDSKPSDPGLSAPTIAGHIAAADALFAQAADTLAGAQGGTPSDPQDISYPEAAALLFDVASIGAAKLTYLRYWRRFFPDAHLLPTGAIGGKSKLLS